MRLVIAEKPSVAASIADVIGAGNKRDGYREGNGFLVSWCFGHLVELAAPDAYDGALKKWDYRNLPIIPENWKYGIKEDTKKQFDILQSLMKRPDVTEIIEATDAGREGELIFRLVYRKAGCTKPIKRLWISSMEESAIREGFNDLKPGSDFDHLYESALCRQRADWLVGINGTRLFTVLYGGKVLKVGRVQTPTLAMIVDREKQITGFVKEPYYQLELVSDGLRAVSEQYKDKAKAEKMLAECIGDDAIVLSVKEEKKTVKPPKLYDLTSLQRDANKLFGFTAKQTLDHTQSLYEKKLVTYPRTDSRYLTDDMEDTAAGVIAAIRSELSYLADKGGSEVNIGRVMNSKKVTDHHAIIPTAEIGRGVPDNLTDGEVRILNLIAVRLLEATGSDHIYLSRKAEIECGGILFHASGKETIEPGFKVYGDNLKKYFRIGKPKADDPESDGGEDVLMMELKENQVISGPSASIKEGFTKPPARYTEDSLLSAMERAGAEDTDEDAERKGLGTPATRADIIEKLVSDGFVKREKKSLVPTEDGAKLMEVIPNNLKSARLTSEWENALSRVAKGEITEEAFMRNIQRMVAALVKNNEKPLPGKENYFGGRERRYSRKPYKKNYSKRRKNRYAER